jgi:hypothetical protein
MKPVEVKIMLLQKGLNFVDMAKKLHTPDGPSRRSLEVMIADLLYGRRWYPTLAQKLRSEFGIRVDRPEQFKSIREQLRAA